MTNRILVVGWDAADWQVIDPLLHAGQMPHLAKLIGRGTRGTLATLHPPYSPILWTSIATGKRPVKHGITGFHEPTPDGRSVRPVSSLSRKTKALWNILSQQGKRSVVTGWYPSHPAEPINGVMVSDFANKAGDGPAPLPLPPAAVWPVDWRERIAELRLASAEVPAAVIKQFVPLFEKIDQSEDKRLHSIARVVAENMNLHAAATEAIAETDWDLACLFYDGCDHFAHGFMRYHPPRLPWVSEADFELYSGVVAAAYRWHDAMLGRLLELAGDDATVFVISDHGFESGANRLPDVPAESAGPTHDHRHMGVLVMAGEGIRRNERVYGASLLDIAPTVLHLLGMPVGRDMDGKVLLNALDDPRPVERIESWDDEPGETGMHPANMALDPVDAVEAMKQLVALGYIAPLAEDAAQAVNEAVLEQHYTLAQSHADAGRPDLADAAYTRMLDVCPDDHRAFTGRINALLALGEADAAAGVLDVFDAMATTGAAFAETELERRRSEKSDADVYRAQPQDERELHERRKLVQALSGYANDRAALRARTLLAQGKPDEAVTAMTSLIEQIKAVGGAIAPAFVAGFYADAGDRATALEWSERALAADGQDWQILALRAQIYLAEGQWQKATAAAADSLSLVYFQPPLHLLLGQALAMQGDAAGAARAIQVAVTQSPALLAGHETLALLYAHHLGAPEKAAWHLAQAQLLHDRRATVPDAFVEDDVSDHGRPKFRGGNGTRPPQGQAPVIVVSGLPRSGTSMVMQALSAAGVPVLTDGARGPDADNPRGYLEFSPAAALAQESGWIDAARGKAVKIVLPLLPHLPAAEAYRVILIQRELREVIASQAQMLKRLGRAAARLTPKSLAVQYAGQEWIARRFLDARPEIAVLPLRYDVVLANPHATAEAMAAFVGGDFDRAAFAAAIDPALRRQRVAPSAQTAPV